MAAVITLARSVERLRFPKDSAVNLAVFRIVVAALFLTTGEVHGAREWARLPPGDAFAPRGWAWALALAPAGPRAANVAYSVLLAAAALGLLGVYARVAFTFLTVAALYLLALPLRNGVPVHYQHLVWFAALCAASPCADALSLREWLGRRKHGAATREPPPRSVAYALPLRAAWVLIGVIFFFPGLWKLRGAGLAWITGDYLRNHLLWRWSVTPGWEPLFRIDRHPVLLRATAAGVIAFELSFVFLIWNRWSRRLAVAAALAFHAAARFLMAIDFSGLWLTYVAFVDWDAIGRRGPHGPPPPMKPGGAAATLVVSFVLIVGAVEAGARGVTVGWPFACYPTFQDLAPTRIPVLAMTEVRPDGTERALDPASGLDAGEVARVRVMDTRLVAMARSPSAARLFGERWRQWQARAAGRAGEAQRNPRAVRFYGSWMSTAPEERDRTVPRGPLLYELALE